MIFPYQVKIQSKNSPLSIMFSNKNILEYRQGGLMFNFVKYTAYILVIIGAINWGLIGFFNYDLVASIFGELSMTTRIIYSLVGISALISIVTTYMCRADCY